jgi:hypothetical protein
MASRTMEGRARQRKQRGILEVFLTKFFAAAWPHFDPAPCGYFCCDARHCPTPDLLYFSVILGLGIRPMRRREFITLIGGAAAAWPVVGRAQQRVLPVVGVLCAGTAQALERYLASFREGMRRLGYVDGSNVHFEFRFADGYLDRLPDLGENRIDITSNLVKSHAAGSPTKWHGPSKKRPLGSAQTCRAVGTQNCSNILHEFVWCCQIRKIPRL